MHVPIALHVIRKRGMDAAKNTSGAVPAGRRTSCTYARFPKEISVNRIHMDVYSITLHRLRGGSCAADAVSGAKLSFQFGGCVPSLN